MASFRLMRLAALAVGSAAVGSGFAYAADDPSLNKIQTVVVIYENRSFDSLYGHFPGANGLQNVSAEMAPQLDRDGTPLGELPPIWNGLTATGVVPAVTQVQTEHLPNAPFAIDDPKGFNQPLTVATNDLWHRFYQNQMQINGGKHDRFVAYAVAGATALPFVPVERRPRVALFAPLRDKVTSSAQPLVPPSGRPRGRIERINPNRSAR